MPGLVSTVSLQTAGLKSIYIVNNDVNFEFESKKTLNKAIKQINQIYHINKHYTPLLVTSKKEVFAFSISFTPRSAGNFSIFALIPYIVAEMPEGTFKKIPIKHVLYN